MLKAAFSSTFNGQISWVAAGRISLQDLTVWLPNPTCTVIIYWPSTPMDLSSMHTGDPVEFLHGQRCHKTCVRAMNPTLEEPRHTDYKDYHSNMNNRW